MSVAVNNKQRIGFTSDWVRTNVDVMETKEIGFVPPPRKWQAECFAVISPSCPIALINAPTGSGKSTMLSMLAYQRTISDHKKKTIIAVPQTVIGKGFSTKVFKLPNGDVIDWSVGVDLCTNANNTVEQLHNFIKEDVFYSKEYPFGRILVCTHATLVASYQRLSEDDKDLYWNNLLICIDETHHLQMHEIADEVYNMNSLGQVVDYSYRNNNEIILVSATMFRGDQKGLLSDEILKDAIEYNLPYDKYMEEMKYLKSFSYDFAIDTNEYTQDISKCINNLFIDNLKKLFIYIPHPKSYMSTGDKIQEIQDILEQLKINLNGEKITLDEKTGIYHITNMLGLDYKVCDLVDPVLSKRTIKFVNNEIINKDINALDCVIALNRAKEGFDWEHANGMIVVGQRNSLTDVIQMVGRLLRDKQGKEKVKALHMLPFSPNQPTSPDLGNSLNDFFTAIAISLLMEDVISPKSIQTNDDSNRESSQSSSSPSSSNIFDELELDENQRRDLFEKAQKSLINIAGILVESQGTYSPEELKEQMPSIMKEWLEENSIEADDEQTEELAKKVYNQFAKRTLQMQGINVSNINWQMIESADPIEFTLRYVGKDTTLESLKELRRLIASGESESNEMCHKLCQWIVENKRNPSLLNDEEKYLFFFMTDMRKGRNNPNNQGRIWYQSNQKIAESYELNNIFDNKDYENIAVENCHKLCQFIKENDRYPKASSEDKIEKTLNTFMLNQRRNKINKSQGKWYPVLEQIASDYGINNLFDQLDDEAICNAKVHELCKFIKSNNNKTPSRTSSDEFEQKMFAFLNGLRQAKKNPAVKKRNFYQSSEEIALSYGLKNLFEVTDKEVISNSTCHELCEYVVKNGKIPAKTTDDEREKFLYAWLHSQKKNKIDNKHFYESNQVIADSYNLNNLFDKIDLEKKSNELCIKWCEFFIKNNRKPTQKDIEFKEINSWYYSQRKAKNGNPNNRFYPSNEIIAESYGIKNVFGDKINVNPISGVVGQ